MSFFDDALKKAVPNGDIATPIAVAAGALILGKMFSKSSAPTPAAPPPSAPVPQGPASNDVLSGLSDLIGKLTAGGQSGAVGSWVGTGANQPIHPADLGSALGEQAISALSQKTGLSRDQLLQGLSSVLPQLVDHLTPAGTVANATNPGR